MAYTVKRYRYIFLSLFIYLERESVCVQEGQREREREREREGERIPSRLCTDSMEFNAGLEPTNREIMT